MSDNILGARSMPAGQDQHVAMREKLCALVDGELDSTEVSATIAACELKDWATYQVMGDVLRRADNVAPVSSTFAARMAAALEREEAHRPQMQVTQVQKDLAESRAAGWRRWFTWPALAMTAAVASVVWIAQPLFEPEVVQLAMSSPPSAPVASPLSNPAFNDAAYRDYTEAHRQMSGPIAIQQATYVPGSSR